MIRQFKCGDFIRIQKGINSSFDERFVGYIGMIVDINDDENYIVDVYNTSRTECQTQRLILNENNLKSLKINMNQFVFNYTQFKKNWKTIIKKNQKPTFCEYSVVNPPILNACQCAYKTCKVLSKINNSYNITTDQYCNFCPLDYSYLGNKSTHDSCLYGHYHSWAFSDTEKERLYFAKIIYNLEIHPYWFGTII